MTLGTAQNDDDSDDVKISEICLKIFS